MSPQFLFAVIIIVIVFDYVFERILDTLNLKNSQKPIPVELEGIYDEEQLKKQRDYEKENSRFDLVTSTFSFLIILFMLLAGGFSFVDNYVKTISESPIIQALLFFGILMFSSDFINIPFEVYQTFKIESKYGFNKTTTKTFVFDKIKGWLLGGILGGGLLSLIVYLITLFPDVFWLYSWTIVSAFSLFMAMFYSSLIVPLFNKQKPLEDGELKNAINDYAKSVGFKLDNVYVIDGSKRSTKANAYFTGFGFKKRVVLYDTLINDLTKEEIVAVLAHEIGHYKKKHVLSMMLLSIIQMGFMFYILGYFLQEPSLSLSLGASQHSIHMALIAFGILYTPLSFLIGIFMNVFSRKNEYAADAYAAQTFDAAQLESGLKKLSQKNLSNLTPHPTYVFFHYSHPPLLQRLIGLRRHKK